MDPLFSDPPTSDIPVDSPIRRYAWARGLSAMRTKQTAETAARIVVGGRTRGYKGRMPGVVEETLLSAQSEKPVFLIGAFGGCARLVIDAIEGIPREELTWEFQRKAEDMSDVRALYLAKGQQWDDLSDVSRELRRLGWKSLNNGLSETENRELAATRSAEAMVTLILRGLKERFRPKRTV
jgi:hypothetical protein